MKRLLTFIDPKKSDTIKEYIIDERSLLMRLYRLPAVFRVSWKFANQAQLKNRIGFCLFQCWLVIR